MCVCVCVDFQVNELYMNSRTTYMGYLFITVKVCVEHGSLLGRGDNRRMVKQCATDSAEQHSSGFEFKNFPSFRLVALLKLKSPSYPLYHF